MLRPLSAALVLAAASACATPSANDPEAVVTALFEAFNAHDADALTALYAEDARYVTPSEPDGFVDIERIRANYAGHFENLPSVHDEVRRMVVDGDTVAVEFVASWDGADGRQTLPIASFITVRDGKIVEDISYFDQLRLMRAAGAAPEE